jgi:hypothetical protein
MTENDERRPARNAAATHRSPATVATETVGQLGTMCTVALDRLLDVRERVVAAIDELEAGEDGIDVCRCLLEGLLEDLDAARAQEIGP